MSTKIEHFRENQAHNKQESMWTSFFSFFVVEKWSIMKGFSGHEEENLQQIYEKELIKIIKIQAIWTLWERVIQARINLDGFLKFLYIFINSDSQMVFLIELMEIVWKTCVKLRKFMNELPFLRYENIIFEN